MSLASLHDDVMESATKGMPGAAAINSELRQIRQDLERLDLKRRENIFNTKRCRQIAQEVVVLHMRANKLISEREVLFRAWKDAGN